MKITRRQLRRLISEAVIDFAERHKRSMGFTSLRDRFWLPDVNRWDDAYTDDMPTFQFAASVLKKPVASLMLVSLEDKAVYDRTGRLDLNATAEQFDLASIASGEHKAYGGVADIDPDSPGYGYETDVGHYSPAYDDIRGSDTFEFVGEQLETQRGVRGAWKRIQFGPYRGVIHNSGGSYTIYV